MQSSFAFALLCATSLAQGPTPLELDNKVLDMPNLYTWKGPVLESNTGNFEVGG